MIHAVGLDSMLFFLFSVASLPHYRRNSTFSNVLNLLFLSFDLSDNVE